MSRYGRDGEKIGKAGQVYLDGQTERPDWVTVNTGLFGTNESFVPLQKARFNGDRLEVPYDKNMIKGAPQFNADTTSTRGRRPSSTGTTVCHTARRGANP